MRWIVISLVVINIAIFGWHVARPKAPAQVATQNTAVSESGAARIQLLSEAGALPSLPGGVNEVEQSAAATGSASSQLCTMVGPFERLLLAEYFQERLSALDVNSAIRELEIPGDTGYWVYLGPLDTRKSAFSKLRELQAKGIDSFVIPKGELENGISFGMFSKKDLAEQRLRDMKSQGYDASLKEIARAYKEVWVVLQPGASRSVNDKTWLQLLSDQEGIERRQNYCPPVATE